MLSFIESDLDDSILELLILGLIVVILGNRFLDGLVQFVLDLFLLGD